MKEYDGYAEVSLLLEEQKELAEKYVKELTEEFVVANQMLVEALTPVFNAFCDVAVKIGEILSTEFGGAWLLMSKDPRYPRIRHFMTYGKERTRKKNQSRMWRLFFKYDRIYKNRKIKDKEE